MKRICLIPPAVNGWILTSCKRIGAVPNLRAARILQFMNRLNKTESAIFVYLGPVVQSIVSQYSSFVVKMLTAINTISNSQVFLLKNVTNFCKNCSHFFSKNISVYAIFNDNFF